MDKIDLKERIETLARPVVQALGLNIWGLEIVPGARLLVRLYVDRPGPLTSAADQEPGRSAPPSQTAALSSQGLDPGQLFPALSATVDDCAEISRHLSLALDVEDCLAEPYVLEVSTPGLARRFFRLAQMIPYVGDVLDVRLRGGQNGQEGEAQRPHASRLRGVLLAVEDAAFTLRLASVTPEGEVLQEAETVRIAWTGVVKACRVPVFCQPLRPGKSGKKAGGRAASSKRLTGNNISASWRATVGGSHES